MPATAVRQARLDDAGAILALLLRLAPEIPLLVDTLEREEALYARIRTGARSGDSWVGVDERGAVIGFVVAEPNQLSRHYAEHEVIDVRYAGVAAEHRGKGLFGMLIRQILSRLVPVTITVGQANRSSMAARLERLGFQPNGPAGGEQRWRWEPGRSPATAS